jgi:DNA polymerase-3 subunit alpha/error-prone DNA polymerase
MDFFQRVRPDDSEARALILCGALDNLAPDISRAEMQWQLALWRNHSAKTANMPRPLFEDLETTPPPLPPDNTRERLRRQFKVLGFLCDNHPMTLFADAIAKNRAVKAGNLPRYLNRRVAFAGWLITGKVVRTKNGDPMEFLTFEDETGVVETTFFPRAYDRFCHLMDSGRPYLLQGRVEENWGAHTLTVDRVRLLV